MFCNNLRALVRTRREREEHRQKLLVRRESTKAQQADRITGIRSKAKVHVGMTEREWARQRDAAARMFKNLFDSKGIDAPFVGAVCALLDEGASIEQFLEQAVG